MRLHCDIWRSIVTISWGVGFFFHEPWNATALTSHHLFVSDTHRITPQTVAFGVSYEVPVPPHLHQRNKQKKTSLNGGLVKMEAWDGEWARSGAEIALMKSLAKIQPAARGRGAAISFPRCFCSHRAMSFRPWWPRTHWIVQVPPPSSSLLLPRAQCNVTNLTWTQTERNLLPFTCLSIFFSCIYFFFLEVCFSVDRGLGVVEMYLVMLWSACVCARLLKTVEQQ